MRYNYIELSVVITDESSKSYFANADFVLFQLFQWVWVADETTQFLGYSNTFVFTVR